MLSCSIKPAKMRQVRLGSQIQRQAPHCLHDHSRKRFWPPCRFILFGKQILSWEVPTTLSLSLLQPPLFFLTPCRALFGPFRLRQSMRGASKKILSEGGSWSAPPLWVSCVLPTAYRHKLWSSFSLLLAHISQSEEGNVEKSTPKTFNTPTIGIKLQVFFLRGLSCKFDFKTRLFYNWILHETVAPPGSEKIPTRFCPITNADYWHETRRINSMCFPKHVLLTIKNKNMHLHMLPFYVH